MTTTTPLLSQTIAADMVTPVMVYAALAEAHPHSFILESVTGGTTKGRYSIIGCHPDAWFSAKGQNYSYTAIDQAPYHGQGNPLPFLAMLLAKAAFTLPEGVPPLVAGWFGSFGYEAIQYAEPVAPHPYDRLGTADIMLMRPTVTLLFDHAFDTLTVYGIRYPDSTLSADALAQRLDDTLQTVRGLKPLPAPLLPDSMPMPSCHSTFTAESFAAAVVKAKAYIAAGDVFQVVPSQRFCLPFTAHPLAFYRALRRLNPSPYLFYLAQPDGVLIGSSPEILVRKMGTTITMRPIAGTRPRGQTAEADAALANDLRTDPKERAEHLMLLDLGRNDVGRIAIPGTVRVTEAFTVERYSHVMHLVSNVEGLLQADKTALDALMAGFPAGTISGAPKIRAMEIIRELEPCARNFYGGAVGYFSVDGSMDTCIALRTALIKDKTLYIQAGAGVVADSVPEAEYQETVNKAKALLSAAAFSACFEIT